ncbi:GH43 family beta-xylosidase [Haloferula luteola]|uniref:GH43 family beta-xylosidase n=1 Tax=Haloferula luteola TaxID=595692 RepID=A0A840VJE0_9BACT|nr:family 43 glycosylhydrolase [Haloferula luteola]MBB5352811.1 GH43 family beta-xylosidase [Haloferula luteola]
MKGPVTLHRPTLLLSLIASLIHPSIAEDARSWTNPLVEQRADPHVFLHSDGYYYMVATVPEYDRIELRRAKTLDGLSKADAKVIWRKHSKGDMGAHIWAPEIHAIGDHWYIYFTSAPAENIWEIRPWVLECDSANPLTGAWKEKGRIPLKWESFALDATTFAHHGKRYFVWTQRGEKPYDGTNIYISLMESPTRLAGDPVMLTYPDYAWETRGHRVNEAPAVLIRHGKVFLTYSASATDANYCLGMLTADEDADLLDPKSWTKSRQPVLESDPGTKQFGTGHNSFTTTPDGQTDILVYHSRNYEVIQGDPLHNPDRATRAQAIRWTPEGQPIFGPPVADGPYTIPSDLTASATSSEKAANPIITEVFTADPAPMVFQDRVYLYVGQDDGDGRGYHMPRWRVYSTDNMVEWKDEGSPLQPSDFSWSTGGPTSWAGHTIEKDGKFYWYITVDHRDVHGKAIGVAVADSPTGPFKDARGTALITNDMTKATGISWDDIDPAAFIDDDGQAWLFWGNQKCYYAKLKSNMTELDGEIHVVPDSEVGGRFTEAPWVHKRNGIYYLSYATGFPEKTAYSVAKSITGPWVPKGLVAEGAQNSNTIHQGIITFKGKDYFFYHSGMLQFDQGAGKGHNGGGSFHRSVCVDELHYNADGSMQIVTQTTEGVDRTH